MKIKLNRKLLYINLIALIGLFIILFYIWFRFIRERLPKEIPFTLNIFSFFCLCFCCLVYMYILYRIFKPATSILLPLFKNKLVFISMPLYYFDKLINNNKYVTKIIFTWFYKIILYSKAYDTNINKNIYMTFMVIPKIVLLGVFILDVFYFKNLQIFYNIIFIGFIPLFYTYSIYSINKYKEIISNYLDKNYRVKMLSTKKDENDYRKQHGNRCFFGFINGLKYIEPELDMLESKYFIEIQAANLMFDYQLYKYTCIETWHARKIYIKKHKVPEPLIWFYQPESDEISKALAKEFHELMPKAYYFQAFIETHYDIVKVNFIKYNKYFLIGYLVCWLYILFISIHTLDFSELLNVLTWLKHDVEPFSGCLL
jgi:hypothetical protein